MFISIEGTEGAGKTTQARLLTERLSHYTKTLLVREPGCTPAAEQLRNVLLGNHGISPIAEALIVAAARADLVARVIRPALDKGTVVITDRYCDTTYVIQGYGLGVPLETLRYICGASTGGLVPDLTILLDSDIEVGYHRKLGQPEEFNAMDERGRQLGEDYRRGYKELMLIDPARWHYVPPTKAAAEIIAEGIFHAVISHRLFPLFDVLGPGVTQCVT